jgi:hypothetical protein
MSWEWQSMPCYLRLSASSIVCIERTLIQSPFVDSLQGIVDTGGVGGYHIYPCSDCKVDS